MSLHRKRLVSAVAIVIGAMCGLPAAVYAQSTTSPRPTNKSHTIHKSPSIYEDREIRVTIPPGWRIVPESSIKQSEGPAMSLSGGVSQARGKVLLEKNRYTLGIAYNTDHASGIEGGRLIEVFNIPWPGVEDVGDCSMYLHGYSQPASRILMFTNLIVNSFDPQVREHCGIQKDIGSWQEEGGRKEFVGSSRWFGGDFSTADGGAFFESKGEECGQKAYTLTFQAKTPDLLPVERDPSVKKMIQEAIDIVNSIQYKRCPPAP